MKESVTYSCPGYLPLVFKQTTSCLSIIIVLDEILICYDICSISFISCIELKGLLCMSIRGCTTLLYCMTIKQERNFYELIKEDIHDCFYILLISELKNEHKNFIVNTLNFQRAATYHFPGDLLIG